ncbi:MAG: family 43 glycosylhydrolase [Lachnospiraceae bacterium]
MTQDEDGFHEGSSIRKINGKYYMVYADISRGRPTCLGYAISDNPLGPYEKKGIIIDNNGCDPSSWNDHGSIQKIGEDYYVFYHRSTHNSVYSRRVCAEKIQINEDGTIDEVEMTTQGAESHIPETRVLTASAFARSMEKHTWKIIRQQQSHTNF